MAEASARNSFAVRFNRAFDAAMVVTVALWQVGAAGMALLAYLDDYRSAAAAVALYAAQGLIIAAASVLLLRRRGGTGWTLSLVAADLATGIAMAANCPGGQQLRINWAWTTVGLIGVLLLMHRPVRELLAFLAVNAGVVLTALVLTGDLNRHVAAGFVVLLYASVSTQLTMVGGARVFRFNGGVAAAAAAERWEMATREMVIEEVAATRQNRYQEAGRLIAPILRGLADGTANPSDPRLRHQCATAEAMLRQLLAEHADLCDPLLGLLQPGIDKALRRGVVVDMARVGEPPVMDQATTSALAQVPLAVLAGTRTYARITVVSTAADQVSVSVLTDGDVTVGETDTGDVDLTIDHEGDLLWVEARWARP
ncbi:hypothetical protein [Actinomadura rubrisoli]|uniref:hypothetical protein n=1 Tax=Actinomadura rubrisoli TaxID=2530368 RepID=UPI001404732B|nr:hypothetical protein [Actinomadura rubrisoli]